MAWERVTFELTVRALDATGQHTMHTVAAGLVTMQEFSMTRNAELIAGSLLKDGEKHMFSIVNSFVFLPSNK